MKIELNHFELKYLNLMINTYNGDLTEVYMDYYDGLYEIKEQINDPEWIENMGGNIFLAKKIIELESYNKILDYLDELMIKNN